MSHFLPLLLVAGAFGQVSIPPVTPTPARADPTSAPATQLPAEAGLRFSWSADHPSGIYFAKEEGKLTLMVDNPTNAGLVLEGEVTFGRLEENGFTPISITPVAQATVPAGRRVRLVVPATFGLPGKYVLRFNNVLVPGVFDLPLESRYPPQEGGAGVEKTIAWTAELPGQALLIDNFLADYVKRTGIRRLVVDDALAADPPMFLKLMGEARKANVEFVWHIALPPMEKVDAAVTANLNKYAAMVLAQGNGVIKAVALDPWVQTDHAMEAGDYRACYLAVYQAAKKTDPTIRMLGTTWAIATRRLLLEDATMRNYVDGIATVGEPADFAVALELTTKTPERLWLLPSGEQGAAMPVAVALAAGLRMVPVPREDRGITLHVFGGAVFSQRIRAETPPYVGIFQGNEYAIAVVAGIGAGTPVDREWPGLPGTPKGTLEVTDEGREMRVVDASGHALERATGDLVEIPLDGRVFYLLAPGNAEDLTSLLRHAVTRHLPVAEVTGAVVRPASGGAGGSELGLKIRNAVPEERGGSVRVLMGDKELGTKGLIDLSPGKFVEVAVPLEVGEEVVSGQIVVVEVTLGEVTTRVEMRAAGK